MYASRAPAATGRMRLRSPHSRAADRRMPATAASHLTAVPAEVESVRVIILRLCALLFLREELSFHDQLQPRGRDLGQLAEDLVGQLRKTAAEGIQVRAPESHETDRAARPGRVPANHVGSHDRLLREGCG